MGPAGKPLLPGLKSTNAPVIQSVWRLMCPSPEVADPFYSQQVIELLQQQQMPPHFLELELTETAMMRDTSVSLMNLKNLQQYGIHIALDDFGNRFLFSVAPERSANHRY